MKAAWSARDLARAQGVFNVIGGAWPIVSLRSFEWVYGKKHDIFLQKTVGTLLFSIGCVQLAHSENSEAEAVIKSLGLATAISLLAIDLVYIPRGEMRKTYMQDALCQVGWIAAWTRLKS